jgi:GGDEF domain-containing protein
MRCASRGARRQLDEPVGTCGRSSERDICVTASVGVARAEASAAEQLLRNADVALYEAKSRGKNTYALYAGAAAPVASR